MEDKFWYLSKINVLMGLSKEKLMELGSQCSMVDIKKGDQIYLPGTSNDIYFLKKGTVKLVANSPEGDELIVDILGMGEIFGKLGESDLGKATESAFAMDDIIICYLSLDQWGKFVAKNLNLNLKLLKWMGFRIKRIERRMDSLYFKGAHERITELFYDLAERTGKEKENGVRIGVRITHEEIAQLTGNSRQSVTTIMNKLRQEGYIQYDRNNITISEKLINLKR